MHFASPLPYWLALVVAVAIAGVAYASYRRPLIALSHTQRAILMALRALALGAIVIFLCRPIVQSSPAGSSGLIVPVLVDASRSMRVADVDGQTRIARAAALVQQLVPALSRDFVVELYTFGDAIQSASADRLSADARHSDVSGAIDTIRDRYRGRRVPGVIVLSDGGDTSGQIARDGGGRASPPVITVGIGSPDGVPDREVLGIAAGDPRIDQSSVDLHVSAVSSRYGRSPLQLRVLGNGRLLESRSVSPLADGSPIDELFTVAPDPLNATVYTAEISPGDGETIAENNSRSVIVSPAGRKRRVLAIERAPGYEHSFLTRSLTTDPGLELDSVVRKGTNELGQGTFLVQAGAGSAPALTTGFPSSREALYGYDALIIANVEGDNFTRAQLAQAAEFVSERGGGLLVMGGRSLAPRGLIGTPLEEALPVELNDRRGGLMRSAFADLPAAHNTVVVTAEGATHPVMRIGGTPDATRRMWSALPALASSAPLGGPKPGATVLAVTAVAGGAVYPVVAVQRYGRGRSMIFAGEASWRWKMMQPSTDRSYDYFWRQAARWLAAASPDPVTIEVPDSTEPGDPIDISIEVRDRAFQPVGDADLQATLTIPGGDTSSLTIRHAAGTNGRFVAAIRPESAGAFRVHAAARRGSTNLGEADRWFYVGGSEREFADPRLNEALLRRIARSSGGQYVRHADWSRIPSLLQSVVPQSAALEPHDLWHQPWAIALVVMLMAAEWILRRRWGLR